MKFTDSHEWIELGSQEIAKIGITYFAQRELGNVIFIELPLVGSRVSLGQEIAVLESTKAATDIYSPVNGIITEVNMLLEQHPELVNQSPEQKGWICKIRLSNASEIDLLMDKTGYELFLNEA